MGGVAGGFDPTGVIEVPADGAAKALGKGDGGQPAEFAGDFGGVEGVTAVVTGAVGDEGDQVAAGTGGEGRGHFVEEIAEGGDHVEVCAGGAGADVVDLAGAAVVEDGAEGGAVVVHEEPVAEVAAVAVEGSRAAMEGVEECEGDQFFRKLEGAVVVGADGGEDGQVPGVEVGAGKGGGGSLGGGVGTAGRGGRGFGERRAAGIEGAVDFVGGDVEKAEGGALGGGKRGPVEACLFEEDTGTFDIGAEEGGGRVDGAVHVAFGGEVDEGAGPMGAEERGDQSGVADVSIDEVVAGVAAEAGEVVGIAGVGEQVEVDDGGSGGLEPLENEVGADEARAAGDQDEVAHHKQSLGGPV